jgi:hypothetical protein
MMTMEITVRLITSCSDLSYPWIMRSNELLNHWKKRFFLCSPGLSRIAASAGDSVSATTPDSTTDTAMVTANCL